MGQLGLARSMARDPAFARGITSAIAGPSGVDNCGHSTPKIEISFTRTERPSPDAAKSAELELLSDTRWRLMGVIAAFNQRERRAE